MDDIHEHKTDRSRAEFVERARQSCYRNLNDSNKGFTKNKKTSSLTYNNSSKTKNSEGEMSPYRSLLIRTICAFAIFLTVVTICSLDGKYGTDHTSSIETMITNNISLEQTQDFFVSILERIK